MEFVWELVAVGCGGFLGSVGRWLVGLATKGALGDFPLGTLVANLVAGVVIGLVTGLGLASPLPERVRLFLAVGLCGGLSTFSSFSNETVQLAQAGSWGLAAANVLLNVALCLAAVLVGLRLAQAVTGTLG